MTRRYFIASKAKWFSLYQDLRAAVVEAVGDFHEHMTTKGINWKHHTSFAEISAKKDCMVVAFSLDSLHAQLQPARVLTTSKNRVVHYFEITDDTLFSMLVQWISKSYEMTKKNPVRKGPEKLPLCDTGEGYIALFTKDIQKLLNGIEAIVLEAVPNCEKRISWGMPSFYQDNGYVLQFAVQKKHVGLYPGPDAIEHFKDRLMSYTTTKGGILLPFGQAVPYQLIRDIVLFNSTHHKTKTGRE